EMICNRARREGRSMNELTRRDWMKVAGAASLLPAAARGAAGEPLGGAFIILSTPYTEAKAVDYEDVAHEVEFLEKCGVSGLVWPQFSSELTQLSKEERMRGMDALAAAVKGRKTALLLFFKQKTAYEMMEYARHAEGLAPDAVIAIPPTKAKTEADYHEYF